MPDTATESTHATRACDPEASARVLADAIARRAAIWVTAVEGGGETAWSGAIVGADASSLTVQIYNLDSGPRLVLGATALQATMVVGSHRYTFETLCTSDVPLEPAGSIRLYRPTTVLLTDRRRSTRRHLREPCTMTLELAGPNGVDRCPAVMLNLSLDGVACRVSEADAAKLRVMQTLRPGFVLASDPDAFELDACVVSLTPSGTGNQVIAGLEFVDRDDTRATRQRLRAALEATG